MIGVPDFSVIDADETIGSHNNDASCGIHRYKAQFYESIRGIRNR